MALVYNPDLKSHNNGNKCGEIILSKDNGEVSLHCIFCEKKIKKLGAFVNHIKLEHSNDWNKTMDDEQEIEPTIAIETSQIVQLSESSQIFVKVEEDNPLELNDNSNDGGMLDQIEDNLKICYSDSSDIDDIKNDKTNLSIDSDTDDSDLDYKPHPDSDDSDLDYKPAQQNLRRKDISSRGKEVVFQLIDEMKVHENIWDNSNIDYHNTAARRSSYESIANKLQTTFPEDTISTDYVQFKIRELIRIFHKTDEGTKICGSNSYYDRLQFLRGRSQKKEVYKRNDAGNYECPLCTKQFQKRPNLVDHIRRHRKEYRCKCDICFKSFYKSSDLRQHMLLHTKEKPHTCEVCGRSFRLLWQLQRHILHHFKERIFKCNQCSKTYFRKDNLYAHLKTHADVPPETCDVCGKNFYTKQNLKNHKKLHSNIKEYVCTVCNKGFAQPSGRSSHVRRAHKSLC